MKNLILLFVLLSLAASGQIRTKNNRYLEISGGIRDLNLNYTLNYGASLSFVSATRNKSYKRLNLGYDTFQFNISQLGKTIPVERYFASYTIEPALVKGKKQRSYIGAEFGGGIGYESINKGSSTIDNFTITNGSSQVVGLLIGGLNGEKFIGKGFSISLKQTLLFSPLSSIQRLTFQSSVGIKFKLSNKL